MIKKVILNIVLTVLIMLSVIIGVAGYNAGNYLIPIACAAAFALSLYYKIKLTKTVRAEFKLKAEEQAKKKTKKH